MARPVYYLGLSVTYHDPALALIDEHGEVLFAEASERSLQSKRALNAEPDQLYYLPAVLQAHCHGDADFVVALNWRRRRPLYETVVAGLGVLQADGLLKTGIKRLRSPLPNYKLHHMMACQRNSIAKAALNLVRILREHYPAASVRLVDYDHHTTHAASACYASGLNDAACAVVDSYGERGSLAFYSYRKGRLRRLHEAKGLGSLGLFYMKLTEWCGFDWLKGEEWKVMGLAAYGTLDAKIYDLLSASLRVEGLGIKHDRRRLTEALAGMEKLRRGAQEAPELAARLAYTGQQVFAERMSELLNNLHALGVSENLALAGGCALNSSFNGQILGRTPYRRLYVPPAPADDGTALGAAYLASRAATSPRETVGTMLSPYLGASMSPDAVERLEKFAVGVEVRRWPATIAEETAKALVSGKLVGWVQGRAEFGPRALGNRSILADPRDPLMKDRINQRVKFREEYRPFAPAVLEGYGPEYFLDHQDSPYMERTLPFRADAAKRVPAVVHVDGTGRLQTVNKEWNPRFWTLIEQFRRLTGIPLLLNTSFNVMGKPIIHSVEDAVAVFMTTGLDVLVIEDLMLVKP
ncbi:MAG: nodulation protein nolNO [Methylotetracoccus sp.]|nr:nodulation protein nolNO [Methylotetracoccus sp.]